MNLFLIPSLGMVGAGIATTISYAFVLFLTTYKIKFYLKVNLPVKEWVKQGIGGLIFLGVIFIVKSYFVNPWLRIIIATISAALVYLISIFVMKAVDLKEIKHYAKLLRK